MSVLQSLMSVLCYSYHDNTDRQDTFGQTVYNRRLGGQLHYASLCCLVGYWYCAKPCFFEGGRGSCLYVARDKQGNGAFYPPTSHFVSGLLNIYHHCRACTLSLVSNHHPVLYHSLALFQIPFLCCFRVSSTFLHKMRLSTFVNPIEIVTSISWFHRLVNVSVKHCTTSKLLIFLIFFLRDSIRYDGHTCPPAHVAHHRSHYTFFCFVAVVACPRGVYSAGLR